jgi:hypothetical protein
LSDGKGRELDTGEIAESSPETWGYLGEPTGKWAVGDSAKSLPSVGAERIHLCFRASVSASLSSINSVIIVFSWGFRTVDIVSLPDYYCFG